MGIRIRNDRSEVWLKTIQISGFVRLQVIINSPVSDPKFETNAMESSRVNDCHLIE
jgi:hypothetical protein